MSRVHLPDDELHRLERVFRTTEDRKLRDRVQIVLMATAAGPTRISPLTWASAHAPSPAGSTPTLSAASTA